MRYLGLLLFSIFHLSGFAQIFDPVSWDTQFEQVNDEEFNLLFTATIDDGWSIYSQYLESDDGPVRTSFVFDKGDHFTLIGKNEETGKKEEGFDKLFEMNVIKFKEKVVFTQKIKVSDLSKPISGYLEFMTCDATRCLPPKMVDYKFELKSGNKSTGATSEEIDESKSDGTATKPLISSKTDEKVPAKGNQVLANVDNESITPNLEESENIKTSDEPVFGAVEEVPADQAGPTGGILKPVSWEVNSIKLAENQYEISFKATMDEGWAIYSQYTGDGGPIPTTFFYDDQPIERIGETSEEGHKKEGLDPVFDVNVIKYLSDQPVLFKQKIKTTAADQPVTGFIDYMTCDDARCIPFSGTPFLVDLEKGIGWVDDIPLSYTNASSGNDDIASIDQLSFYPKELENINLEDPQSSCGQIHSKEEKKGIWGNFILGFLGGLFALLTPCVFPMIPLTVSFFTKSSQDKRKGMFNAFLYGFFIFGVYLLLSVPFHLMDSIDPGILNQISTNPWLNLSFFAIFLFFAFSFFGYYELTLPSSWANKASQAEGVGGMLGIFFMALTLAIVSFSCTGPILGSLLALSANGGASMLTAGMGGFGLALALPFALFAAFPGWMNSLPKSGGWLTTVKVVLGFLELGLALKFLSNADLVDHWGILKYELFLGIWILLSVATGLYLLGMIKFPHDSPVTKLSIGRISLAVVFFAFAAYMVTGFRYDERSQSFTALSLLSGLAPPTGYSWTYPKECPNNLDCFKDLNEGWAYAKKVNKPILIDFSGYACVNCRKMEENVWPTKKVYPYLQKDYVLISLYTDDKKELPENEQVEVKEAGSNRTKKLRTYGNKWEYVETIFFKTNSQPFYALVSPQGKLLNLPVGYTPDQDEYASFLECGLQAFEEEKDKQLLGDK